MCRTCGKRHNSYEMNPSSSGLQDVSLEPAGSIPFSFGLRSPGKSSPLRGRNMKDYEEQLEHLKKENFSLKLRIYFLEEKMSHKGIKEDKEELHKANIEMKVETEALKKQLCDKQELLRQAARLLNNMENQYKEELQAIKETHERESQELWNNIEALKKDLEEYAERAQQEGGDLTRLCGLAFNNLGDDAESKLIEESKPCRNNSLMTKNSLQGIFSMQDPSASELEERSRQAINHSLKEAPEVIPESAKNRIKKLEEEVETLTNKVKNLQKTLNEKEQTSKALQEDIINLKKEIEDRDEKVSDLEYEVNEKDQKVDQLMQELETRHLEIKAKNSTIQNLHDDLNKVEPQIEVKVQEINEKDKIIEEKMEQLQQQNKILVEIQITLDEKQKQISELEESLATTKQRFEKLNHDFEFSLRTIKEMASEVATRDKEIDQLKKEVKKREKKVKDLLDQLREATDMLKKAKWEAETSGGQDSVKEMVEEENERLWAELEQQKVEIRQLHEQKEALHKEIQEKEQLLQKEKLEMQEKLNSLQNQIANEGKGDRDKISEIKYFKEVMESRENLLRNLEEIIESLKTELAKTKDELAERKEELKDLKNELSKKNSDMHDFFTKELLGRSKEFRELQDKLLSMPLGKDNQLEAFKLFLEANPININLKPNDNKESQNHFQVRSSSLPKISETATRCVENENPPEQSAKSGRSNSFSLLENLLYANMGQKVYNTNQTFNTYVLSSEVENNEGEIVPMKDINIVPSFETIKGEIGDHKTILETHLRNINVKERKNSYSKTENDPCTNSETESHVPSENVLETLYEEVSNTRNEAQALRRDREILTEKVCALETLNQQLLNGSGLDNSKYFKVDSQNLQRGENDGAKEAIHLCSEQINTLKGEFKDTKQKVSLQMLQVASIKYQESLKNYKEEIISLRKRLADSHNACNLLRNRLEELLDFFEQILDMDRNGIINLSHLSATQKSSLRKSLSDSRSLSLSLSHSLMIGMDSVLNDSVATQNDAEASRFCLPADTFAEEFELTHHGEITMPEDIFNYSELSKPEPTNDFLYYSFATKIHSQIDNKSKELDALVLKMNEIYSILKSKDEDIETKNLRIITLENQIARLKEEISVKNQFSLQSHTSGSSGTVVEQRKSSSPFDMKSNSSLHLSTLEHSAVSHDLDSKIADRIFIFPRRESSCSDILPPPQSYISSSDDHVALLSGDRFSSVSDSQVLTRSTSQSDNVSVYSTDVSVKSLPQYDKGDQDLTLVSVNNIPRSMSRINLEQPSLPPSFAVASPSESEAWSEPDRNVSLARIGLETCNIVSASHDRSISRSRMTRSAPFTSESEGEANSEEVKEGSVGLGNTVAKSKRRSDASEIKRLTSKLKNLEQLTVTLKEELHIYQTLIQQFNSSKCEDKYQPVSLTSLDMPMTDKNLKRNNQTLEEIMLQNENDNVFIPAIPSSLLNEIRSLRMKLEEAITKNDLLRDQLEAALSGYLSEETKSLNVRLTSLQQELKCNQEKIIMASKTEQQLRLLVKENESKMFELGERLADYITKNQKQEKDINVLTRDLHNVKEKLVRTEEELENTQPLLELRNSSSKIVDSQILQMEANINSLKAELKKLQQLESDKGRRIEEQDKYISALEEAKKDCELKLLEQDSTIKELCQSITLLQQETNKSSMSDQLVMKLKEDLQNSERRLLEITKERFALLGDKTRLQAQLASATTHANLLKKEVRDLSVSDDGLNSESGNQELQSAQATIKELLKCKDLWLSEKQTLQNEMHLTREENSALRSHLDHFLSRETASNSKEAIGATSTELSYSELNEQYVALEISHNNILSEKSELEVKLIETQEKEKELKATIKEHEMRTEELLSKLDAERYLTKNLQMQIKRLQLDSTNLKVPSDYDCGITNTDFVGSGNKPSRIKAGKDNLSPWEKSLPPSWTWGEDKENRYTHTLSRATHSLPIIDDEATSGDSPDLGIGSDGQFSSLERLSNTRSQRVEQNKKLLTFGDLENENVVRRLCSEPSHSQLLSEIHQLREEKEALHSELSATKESLKESISKLTKANQRKESIEKAMVKQLGKTYDVLQKSNNYLNRAKAAKLSVKPNPSRTQNDQKPQTG